MENELWANMQQLKHCEIAGHGVWLYTIDCAIGQLQIVEYEGEGKALSTKVFYDDIDKAEKLFRSVAKKLVVKA